MLTVIVTHPALHYCILHDMTLCYTRTVLRQVRAFQGELRGQKEEQRDLEMIYEECHNQMAILKQVSEDCREYTRVLTCVHYRLRCESERMRAVTACIIRSVHRYRC